jgi:hypothetical protein
MNWLRLAAIARAEFSMNLALCAALAKPLSLPFDSRVA